VQQPGQQELAIVAESHLLKGANYTDRFTLVWGRHTVK
jgi:hypothetical protein